MSSPGATSATNQELLKKVSSNVLSFFNSNPSSSSLTETNETNPEDIPKDDLMALCMKMNKRMQIMESKASILNKRHKTLLSERRGLIDLLQQNIPSMSVLSIEDEQDIDIQLVGDMWSEFSRIKAERAEEQTKATLAAMEDRHRAEIAALSVKMKASSIEEPPSDASEAPVMAAPAVEAAVDQTQELEALKDTHATLSSRLQSLEMELETTKNKLEVAEGSVRIKSHRVDELEKEVENVNGVYEEKMQLNVSKGRDESRDRELAAAKKRLQEVLDGSRGLEAQTAELAVREAEQRKTAETLAKKLSEMEPELKRTQRALAEYERHSGVAAMMKAEQESIVHGLRRDLKTSMDVREQLLKRVAEFEPTRAQLELTATQLASAQEQVEVLQASLEEKAAIVKRMAAEAQTNLAQHAIRTAMLATCEEQLESLQAALDAKDAALRQSQSRVSELEEHLAEMEKASEELVAEYVDKLSVANAQLELTRAQLSAELAGVAKDHEAAVEALKKDFSKKSTTARLLLSEKEEAIRSLTQRVGALEEEIFSGAPQERKIFELAQAQAKREASIGLHKDHRELVLQQLQDVLAAKDHDLARLQQSHNVLLEEVAELRRTHRREGVNMDYLKNVVLQYMTFPLHSTERRTLVPVIAMLLQFSKLEMQDIQRAEDDPTWNPKPIKELKRGGPSPPASPQIATERNRPSSWKIQSPVPSLREPPALVRRSSSNDSADRDPQGTPVVDKEGQHQHKRSIKKGTAGESATPQHVANRPASPSGTTKRVSFSL